MRWGLSYMLDGFWGWGGVIWGWGGGYLKPLRTLLLLEHLAVLIRLILSALYGCGRDISKKEYYYACVQDMGSRYINSSCLYVESATVLFLHNSVTHKTFVCYSAVQLLRDGSNVAAQWFLVVLMWHLRILAMAWNLMIISHKIIVKIGKAW